MNGIGMNVAVNTTPEGPIMIRLVTDADRDAPATGATLVIKWTKNTDSAPVTLTSGTHYAAVENGNGLYAITLTETSLFGTAGGAVMNVSASGADDVSIPFWIYTPGNLESMPATLTAAERNAIADHIWRRRAENVEASTNGDSLAGNEVISGLTMMLERIGATSADVSAKTKTIKTSDGTTVLLVIDLTTGSGMTSPVIAQSPRLS